MTEKFFKYFDERYRGRILKDSQDDSGPVITISRQTGCDAVAVAKKLVIRLNREYDTEKWRWIDKEILLNAARELDTGAHNVESYVKRNELSGLSEMLMALSGKYISDAKVRKTIREVVLTVCREGYVVMVGRGGVALTGSVKRALHVRLVAPFYWRVENIMKKRKLEIEAAEEFVVDTDEKRHSLILNFMDKKPINLDYLFDVTLNRSSFTVEQLAGLICLLYRERMDAVSDDDFKGRKGPLMDAYG
ncbi:MAG: cytidylate kinase-like family protein [Bacteroidales bacterium]|jgi:cytidylate kinase|nr:cytidylate kinase-like family protein [Bacteroidales bacterium]